MAWITSIIKCDATNFLTVARIVKFVVYPRTCCVVVTFGFSVVRIETVDTLI